MTPNRIFWGLMGLIGAMYACVLLAQTIGRLTGSVLVVAVLGGVIAAIGHIVLQPYVDRIVAEGFLGSGEDDDADDADLESPFGSDVTTLFLGLFLIFAGGLAMPWQPDYPFALAGGALMGWQVGSLFRSRAGPDDVDP